MDDKQVRWVADCFRSLKVEQHEGTYLEGGWFRYGPEDRARQVPPWTVFETETEAVRFLRDRLTSHQDATLQQIRESIDYLERVSLALLDLPSEVRE